MRLGRGLLLVVALTLLTPASTQANPAIYQPGIDPGVGFNLVSWGNFGNGSQVWENAVQRAYDAGFDDVSLSPVRFYSPGVGSIATSSSSGPELSHVAAGVARAKQLGMRVTVNPFVEPVNFDGWRGLYDPTPGSAESTTFWSDYEQYIVDVAAMAESNGADSITVGTELRGLTRNAGNNANWNSVINAADSAFSGSIGYAANWDNYDNANVASTIWDHPAIDYIGIDSYFQGLLSTSQADGSGTYPDTDFLFDVEDAWNNKLDNEILPFAAARQAGAGLPVEFTEIGYLPRNRTTVTPQGESQPLDADEQNMAFEGLMRALDGRLASGEFLATHIWQWDMQGSAGSTWNMNPNGGNQPSNQQTAQWLSSFVNGTNPDPGDPPVDPPTDTKVLYSFESGLDGFYYPNFETEPASTLTQASGNGVTDGEHSLAITKPTATWTWDARVEMSGEQLQTLRDALADNDDDYILEIDVSYVAGELPLGLSDLNMHVSIETNTDGWNQVSPYADISGPADRLFTVEIPLSDFNLSGATDSANLHLGFAGAYTGDATIYIDRIAITDTKFVPLAGDFNNDGIVDTADYTVWRMHVGSNDEAAINFAGVSDGVIDAADYVTWKANFGATASGSLAAAPVSEPHSCLLLLLGAMSLAALRRLGIS